MSDLVEKLRELYRLVEWHENDEAKDLILEILEQELPSEEVTS